MEIWLLLTVTGMISSADLVPHNEEERSVEVPEGSPVTLFCNPTSHGEPERCRVSWHFKSNDPNRTGLLNLSSGILCNCSNVLNWTLPNVTWKDSGLYFCQVSIEIPVLQKRNGTRTRLTVYMGLLENTAHNPTTYRPTSQTRVVKKVPDKPNGGPAFARRDLWIWIAVGVSGLVLLILLIVFIQMRRNLRKRRERTVYANMNHLSSRMQPSPRARPNDTNDPKAEPCYQNMRIPDPNKRYERSRRLSPNR